MLRERVVPVAWAFAASVSLLAGCPRPAPEGTGGMDTSTGSTTSSTGSGMDTSTGSTGSSTGSSSTGSSSTGSGCPGMTDCGGKCVDTSQDATNCGACGHDCKGGECKSSVCRPIVLASNPGTSFGGMAIDAANVYWTATDNANPHSVRSVPTAGGASTTLLSNPGIFGQIAVDSTYVYWTVVDLGLVLKTPKVGGMSTPMTVASGENQPTGITADGASIIWTTLGTGADGTVIEHEAVGFMATTLAGMEGAPNAVTFDDLSVYWTASSDGAVRARRKLGGGSPLVTLATAQAGPSAIAVDTNNVYWVNGGNGSVMKLGLADITPMLVAQNQLGVYGIAVDDTYIYWTVSVTGKVVRAPIAGGGPSTTIADKQAAPLFIAVDANNVYWANASDGTIMKLPK